MDQRKKDARQSMYALSYGVSRLLWTCIDVQTALRDDPDGAAKLKTALESGEARAVVTATWTAYETFEVGVVIEPASKDAAAPLEKFEGSIAMDEACRAAKAYNNHISNLTIEPEVEAES